MVSLRSAHSFHHTLQRFCALIQLQRTKMGERKRVGDLERAGSSQTHQKKQTRKQSKQRKERHQKQANSKRRRPFVKSVNAANSAYYISFKEGHAWWQHTIREMTFFSQSTRGRQCTAMATYAVAFTKIQNFADWQKCHLDLILLFGDFLYRTFVNQLPENEHGYLLISDIPSHAVLFNENSQLDSAPPACGLISRQQYLDEAMSLDNAVKNVFSQHSCAILIIKDSSVMLHKSGECVYYVFDSHSRDKNERKAFSMWKSCPDKAFSMWESCPDKVRQHRRPSPVPPLKLQGHSPKASPPLKLELRRLFSTSMWYIM